MFIESARRITEIKRCIIRDDKYTLPDNYSKDLPMRSINPWKRKINLEISIKNILIVKVFKGFFFFFSSIYVSSFEMKSVTVNKFSSSPVIFYVQYFIRKLSIQLAEDYPRSERE